MIDKKDITGIILAGGKSSRMKSDKGLLTLNKSLFIEHIINALTPLVNNIIIVSNSSHYDEFGYKRVNDLIKDSGPVAGIYTGLKNSKTEYNLILSCDIPQIKTEVLEMLIIHADINSDIIQIESQGKTMPLIAMYKKDCLIPFKDLLDRGEKRLRVAVAQLNTKTITIDSEMDQYVENINTIEQLIELRNGIEN